MANLLDLAKWCNALPDQIEKEASELAKKTVAVMAADLIEHTPVDTSEHVSNWQASINSPPSFGLPAIYLGERGSTREQSGREALAHVRRTLAMKEPGETVYLSNLGPVIEDLNNGLSSQEPAGFVERGIAIGANFVKKAKLGIK